MTGKNDSIVNNAPNSESQAIQIKVNMLQGEYTGQPKFSNFASAQSLQGVVFVDFSFLDLQRINALNQGVLSDEKVTNPINAILLCRMVLSTEATLQLANQLNQLFNRDKAPKLNSGSGLTQPETTSSVVTDPPDPKVINASAAVPQHDTKEKKGFRLPWSKKIH